MRAGIGARRQFSFYRRARQQGGVGNQSIDRVHGLNEGGNQRVVLRALSALLQGLQILAIVARADVFHDLHRVVNVLPHQIRRLANLAEDALVSPFHAGRGIVHGQTLQNLVHLRQAGQPRQKHPQRLSQRADFAAGPVIDGLAYIARRHPLRCPRQLRQRPRYAARDQDAHAQLHQHPRHDRAEQQHVIALRAGRAVAEHSHQPHNCRNHGGNHKRPDQLCANLHARRPLHLFPLRCSRRINSPCGDGHPSAQHSPACLEIGAYVLNPADGDSTFESRPVQIRKIPGSVRA